MRRTASEALAVIADAGLRPEDFAYGRQGCTGYLTRINNGEIVPYGKRVQDALGSDDKWVMSIMNFATFFKNSRKNFYIFNTRNDLPTQYFYP